MNAAAAKASTSSSHFALFGLTPAFAVDLRALEKAYREIQSRVHPDRFAHAGEAERRASLQWTTRVNEGFQVLRNPVSRASHLLATNTAMPREFLMQQMELRESLEAAAASRDPNQLQKLQDGLALDKASLEKQLAQRIDGERDYAGAANLVRELQFLEKLEAEIDSAYEAIE
jgi:molecular chaperone HscB